MTLHRGPHVTVTTGVTAECIEDDGRFGVIVRRRRRRRWRRAAATAATSASPRRAASAPPVPGRRRRQPRSAPERRDAAARRRCPPARRLRPMREVPGEGSQRSTASAIAAPRPCRPADSGGLRRRRGSSVGGAVHAVVCGGAAKANKTAGMPQRANDQRRPGRRQCFPEHRGASLVRDRARGKPVLTPQRRRNYSLPVRSRPASRTATFPPPRRPPP